MHGTWANEVILHCSARLGALSAAQPLWLQSTYALCMIAIFPLVIVALEAPASDQNLEAMADSQGRRQRPHKKSRGGCTRCKLRKVKVGSSIIFAPYRLLSFVDLCHSVPKLAHHVLLAHAATFRAYILRSNPKTQMHHTRRKLLSSSKTLLHPRMLQREASTN